VIEFGRSYVGVVELLHRTARRVHVDVVGFSDMSVEQVATAYDLSLSRARLAKLREYDEPVRVINGRDGARERLLRSLYAAGLASNYQGAYDHIGAAVDKGTSVKLLTALFRRTFGPLITIGVGSTTNSAALLRSVDVPFIVASDRAAPDLQELPRIPRLHLTPGVVPWIEAIGEIARQTRETHDRVRTLG
jgi:mannosyl-3-phosphoglycerate phosphatase